MSILQTINLVMILSVVKKHKSGIILFVLIFLFIFLCVFFRKISVVNSVATALQSVKVNIENLFDDFLVPGGMKSSFTIEYESCEDEYFKNITLANSRENSYMYLGLSGGINLNAFSHKNKLGLYLTDNPEIRYTVSSKNLPSKWNNSVYGKFLKIPSFVPDNLSYKKINSLLNCKKLIKASVVFGLGKDEMSIKELTKNMSVSKRDTYPMMLNEKKETASLIRVTVPKKDIISCISHNLSSTNKKYKGYAVEYINNCKKYLESVDDKELNIDLVLCRKNLIEAKLVFDSKLIVFNNEQAGIAMYIKEQNSGNLLFEIKVVKPSPKNLMINITSDKNYILKVQKNNKNMIYAELEELNPKHTIHKLTYHPGKFTPDINYSEKDIYSLSLYELMYITENIMKKSSL